MAKYFYLIPGKSDPCGRFACVMEVATTARGNEVRHWVANTDGFKLISLHTNLESIPRDNSFVPLDLEKIDPKQTSASITVRILALKHGIKTNDINHFVLMEETRDGHPVAKTGLQIHDLDKVRLFVKDLYTGTVRAETLKTETLLQKIDRGLMLALELPANLTDQQAIQAFNKERSIISKLPANKEWETLTNKSFTALFQGKITNSEFFRRAFQIGLSRVLFTFGAVDLQPPRVSRLGYLNGKIRRTEFSYSNGKWTLTGWANIEPESIARGLRQGIITPVANIPDNEPLTPKLGPFTSACVARGVLKKVILEQSTAPTIPTITHLDRPFLLREVAGEPTLLDAITRQKSLSTPQQILELATSPDAQISFGSKQATLGDFLF